MTERRVNHTGGRQSHASAKNSFEPADRVGKCRQVLAAGGQGRRPGGRSLRNRAIWGGEAGAKRERTGVIGEIWEGDRR